VAPCIAAHGLPARFKHRQPFPALDNPAPIEPGLPVAGEKPSPDMRNFKAPEPLRRKPADFQYFWHPLAEIELNLNLAGHGVNRIPGTRLVFASVRN
jgi:hypothetical protein